MSPLRPVLFTFITICLVCASASPVENVNCGSIFDGLTDGKFDLDEQLSSSSFGANWVGFGHNVLSYDWAIFSDASQLKKEELSTCLTQLRVLPDVQGWTSVSKQKSAINNNLALQTGKIYYSAVRVTLRNGQHIFLVSDGVRILEAQPLSKSIDHPEQKKSRVISSDPVCSIEENHDCRPVVDILNELYGSPNFFKPNPEIFPKDDDDDDDSGANHDGVLGTILGVAILLLILFFICCLLLCCLLAILACLKGKGLSLPERAPKEKKPPAADPLSFDEVPEESKGYGQRETVDTGDVATATVVEFPDTNIRRLSISHKDEAPGQDDEPRRGRANRPAGIMTSASSSFRDYRSTLNH